MESPGVPQGAIDHTEMAAVLARFAGTLVGQYTLDDVMAQLGADVGRILGVAGAGVMMGDDLGRLHFVATSDGVLQSLEALQIELDEGPCLMAYRTGEIVIAADLAADERFPAFGPKAVACGMRAVHSFPMALDGTTIGALNLYAAEAGGPEGEQAAAGQTFADVATAFLVHARDLQQREIFTDDLQRALSSRVVVEQAKGYVAAKRAITPTAAFELLRRYARDHRVKVQVVARGVVEGDIDVGELLA
jgi:GAF domain-containing protein